MLKRQPSKKYRDYLFHKMIRYALGIIIVLYLVFLIFIAANSYTYVIHSTQKESRQIAVFLEDVYNEYHTAASTMALQPELSLALKNDSQGLLSSNRLLYEFCNSQSIRGNFILMNAAQEIISTNLYRNNSSQFIESQVCAQMLLHLNGAPADVYICDTHLNYDNNQTGCLIFSKAVPDSQGRILGYLFLEWRYEEVYQYLKQYHTDRIILTDQFHNIIFDTDYESVEATKLYRMRKYYGSASSLFSCLLQGADYYICQTETVSHSLQVFAHTSLFFQEQLFSYGTWFMASLLVICPVCIFIISSAFVDHNMASIDELVEAAKKLGEGNYDYRVSTQKFDEFQILNQAFNNLTENLQLLGEKNRSLNEIRQRLEIKQLKNQFNPHFVFNTLESIRYSIILKPEIAAAMTLRFANLLRYNMDMGDSRITLQTDLDFLSDYLSLQKMRFGQCLDYSIQVEHALLDCKIPKYLLQPLVENCLCHGMKRTKLITILIAGHQTGEQTELSVTDTGDGMDSETLSELLESLKSPDNPGIHFGLYSVQKTIQLLYGEKYGLKITSSIGEGTCVRLILPLLPEGE